MRRLIPTIVLLALTPPVWAQAPSLTLEDALKGLFNAPDWKSADLSYESAVRQLEATQAASGFKLSGGASYSLSNPIQPSGSSQSSLGVSATASLGVLPWTDSADAVRSAARALDRAALTRRDTHNTLYLNLATQYFNLRQANNNLKLAQATQAWRQNQLRVVTAQNQAGAATLDQVLTAQQNLDSANSNLVNTTGTLELVRLTLANTLGVNPQSLGQPSTTPTEPNLPPESLETLLQRALFNRSDLLKAQSQLLDSQDSLSSAQRDRLIPDTSLTLGYAERTGTQSQTSLTAGLNFKSGNASLTGSLPLVTDPALTGTSQTSWSLGLSLALPIIDPSSDSKIASAQTALALGQAALDSARRAAELDLRQKYQTLQTAKASITVAKSTLESANQALRTAQAKLQAGTGTALDVQSAQVNQLQAQIALEAALTQAQIASVSLQNAIGTDLAGGNP